MAMTTYASRVKKCVKRCWISLTSCCGDQQQDLECAKPFEIVRFVDNSDDSQMQPASIEADHLTGFAVQL